MRKLGKMAAYAVAAVLAVLVLAVLALKLALDRVPEYQAQIKDWVHARIGYHIAFTAVSPAFRWYGPELKFEGLELRSKDDTRVLARAAVGRIGADVWKLLGSGKLLAGRIELDAPTIELTRLGPTDFALGAELSFGQRPATVTPVRLNDLPAGTVAIRRGVIIVQNWNAALPRLVLNQVNLNVVRGDDVAQVDLTARLPGVLGGELHVTGSARGAGNTDSLDWAVVAQTGHLALAGWRELLPQYLARLEGGSGGFEFAAHGRGHELTRADLRFEAADVTTQLAEEPGVKFDHISGALSMTHAGDLWTLTGRRVLAQSGSRRDPLSEFDVSWRGDDAGLVELHARASYLRAETLLPLAGLVPQKDIRERLQDIEPTGEWLNTHVNLSRAAPRDPWRFDVQAQFRGVGFAPVGLAPGLRGLNGRLVGTDAGGHVDLDGPGAVFTWPRQLTQPVPLQAFRTTLYWKRSAEEVLIATPSIEMHNADAVVHGKVAWRQPADGSSPVLTVAAGIENGNVANTHLYLPRAQLKPPALNWLDRAFVAGTMPHADLIVNGPIRHFPFRDGSGLFLARTHLENVTLDYREGWPPARGLAFVAEFRNEGMDAKLEAAHIGDLTLTHGEARFLDFKTSELRVRFTASGDAAAGLDYLRATPLDGWADHLFSSIDAEGTTVTEVDLFLPFKQFEHRRVFVDAALKGVALKPRGGALGATELTGDVELDGSQVARADVHGNLLGGSFQMQSRAPRGAAPIGAAPPSRTLLLFNGNFRGEALHAALGLPAAAGISGSADWRGVLRVSNEPSKERSLRITSSLAGLDWTLPAPLVKRAGAALPSTLDLAWPADASPQLRLTLGDVVRAHAILDNGVDGTQLARAAVTFGADNDSTPFSDSQVVSCGGSIERLDLGGWLALLPAEHTGKPLGNLLRTATVEVGQIDYLGLSFHDVAVELAAREKGWRIDLGGPNVVGTVVLPGGADLSQPWELEFQRLKFVDEAAEPARGDAAGAGPEAGGLSPRAIPAIRFHAADLIWDERQLGDVKATLSPLEDGTSLRDLSATGGSFKITANGEWRGKDAGTARIEGSLVSSDVGATLKQLGYAQVMEAKSGKMDFDVTWRGAPTAAHVSDAVGSVQVALDKGQITGLKPGAGRLVGLASVAALPRRLALDFSDLTDKGFAFDTIRGSFDLRDGSAFTDDILVKGPAADIGLIGRVGLKAKDYDQTAVVTGNVGSSLPLAAFAGGPVIGGAVLVFTQVFKQPLRGLARGYYRITGSWDNPSVDRIKSADAAAAAAEVPKTWEK